MAYYYSKQASEAKGALWGCPFGNTGVELGARNQRIVGKISEIFDDAIDHLQTTLQEAVRNGELTNIDPRETATASGLSTKEPWFSQKPVRSPNSFEIWVTPTFRCSAQVPRHKASILN